MFCKPLAQFTDKAYLKCEIGFVSSLKHFVRSAFAFGTMCSASAERDVRFAREDAEHITSLCDEGAIHHFGAADTSLFANARKAVDI